MKSIIRFIKELIEKLYYYDNLNFHLEIAQNQRKFYNKNCEDKILLKNSILIDMDFKQKIIIGLNINFKFLLCKNYFKGLSSRQVSKEFYEQQTRTILGFGIYYLNEKEEIKLIHVDIVTEQSTNALCLIRCLRLLRNQEFFKKKRKTQLDFMDGLWFAFSL